MTSILRPEEPGTVRDVVAWAAAEQVPLEVVGHASRRGVGRPVQAEHSLDLSGLTGVTLYEPEELVLSARAGTPVTEIEALLAARGQAFAFEPMDHGPLAGMPRGRGTVGGVLAGNVSGPRRIQAGAARDHVLGIHAVSGRGESFKSGGRVVKNVTGYDLSKGVAGSWGTLAVVTDVTFKVLPMPETAATLAVSGLDDDAAIAALCTAMGTPWDVSGAAHLPAGIACPGLEAGSARGATTCIRIEGFAPSVSYRAEKLRDLLAPRGDVAILDAEATRRLWLSIRDAEPFGASSAPVWRVSVAPTSAPSFVSALRPHRFRHFYDWSGGLVWIEMQDESRDALAQEIRAAVDACGGGHATLLRGSPALRSSIEPFQPQPAPLAALSRRLKEQFDPRDILNPGRLAP